MKRKFVFFALLAACVSATCSMCGNDSDTPEYEFPDGPEPEPEPEPEPPVVVTNAVYGQDESFFDDACSSATPGW